MTARVLVVDDVLANVKLLEARLTAEYFDVVTATSGPEALTICERGSASGPITSNCFILRSRARRISANAWSSTSRVLIGFWTAPMAPRANARPVSSSVVITMTGMCLVERSFFSRSRTRPKRSWCGSG